MPEPIYRLSIEYDPVTKQVQLRTNFKDELTIFGLLELGKSTLIRNQIGATESRIELPKGIEPI